MVILDNYFLVNDFEGQFHELWFWEERAIEEIFDVSNNKEGRGVEMTLLRRSLMLERDTALDDALPQKSSLLPPTVRRTLNFSSLFGQMSETRRPYVTFSWAIITLEWMNSMIPFLENIL